MDMARGANRLSLLVCALGLLVAAAPADAAKVRRTKDAVGVGVGGILDRWGHRLSIADEHVKLAGESGIRLGRTDAFWAWGEPNAPQNGRHRYDWSRLDNAPQLLAHDGIRWLPILDYSTYWAATVSGNDKTPPKSDADFAAYAEAFARRYGRGGSFWSEHPELPALPVTAYEVWNEPNLHVFWQPTPDPVRYAGMFLAARDAIKRADPKATVMVGGLAPYADTYVKDMYAARPELRSKVDAVAYHPYAADADLVLRLVRRLRGTLDDLGEDDVPLWITEVGWPTQGTGGLSASALPDPTRGGNLSLVTDSLLASNCDVETITPYTWATPESDPEHDEMWLGMFHPNTKPTEEGTAYVASVARNAQAAGHDPQLALELCRDRGSKFAKPLKLGIAVESTGGGCREATVTYRGRPLNGVTVDFGDENAKTDENGVARHCGQTRGDVSARVLDVASTPG
jgi:hypothetical protein